MALAAARRKYPYLSAADHEDIVQEAIVRVLGRLQHGSLEDPASYLLRVVFTTGVGVLRDRHRAALSLEAHNGEQDGVQLQADRSITPLSPEEHVLSRQDAGEVWRVLIEELTLEERLVLVRRSVEGRSPAEVANELGSSVRRYRHVLERAGRKLAEGVERGRGHDALLPPSRAIDTVDGPPGR
jgi:RNA polymerase sigma factor (sigma-70 family)